ncbi:MAG: hypothetical protein QOE19_1148 [Actinomycetota bacterium]|nr:hypothetical protein [Actinomycetota bacterium]
MTIVSLSMSHRTPPAEVLERLVVSSAQRAGMLARYVLFRPLTR